MLADLVEAVAGDDRGRRRRAGHLAPLRRVASARWPRPSARGDADRGRRAARGRRRARRAGRRRRPGRARVRALVAPHALERAARRPRPATPSRALALLDRQRLLCAHREGPYGVRHWNPRSSAGSARRPASRSGRPGTPGARCWSPPTTTASASTTATPASPCGRRPARRPGAPRRGRRQHRPARPRHQPARPGRDDARADDPQEPGQPGRRGRRDPAAAGVAAADPRALLHRDHPRPGARRRGRLARRRPRRRSTAGRPRDRLRQRLACRRPHR